MIRLLVSVSLGLIGWDVCSHLAALGVQMFGLDYNQRAVFFGDARRHALDPAAAAGDAGYAVRASGARRPRPAPMVF
jgi:hypothetical protein